MKAQDMIKKLFFVAGCAALFCAVNVNDSHAASATANSQGTVIKPIEVLNVNPLHFGSFLASASAGTIIVDKDGNRNLNGYISPASINDPASAASFTVSGEKNSGFAISLPQPTMTLSREGGSETMTVDLAASAATGSLDPLGAAAFTVGGTLNVGASQVAGVYKGTFNVNVDYN